MSRRVGAGAQVARDKGFEREETHDIVKHSIDAETAEKAVAAAANKAAELKLKMCIAVTDEAGDLEGVRPHGRCAQAFHRNLPGQGLYRRLILDADPFLV